MLLCGRAFALQLKIATYVLDVHGAPLPTNTIHVKRDWTCGSNIVAGMMPLRSLTVLCLKQKNDHALFYAMCDSSIYHADSFVISKTKEEWFLAGLSRNLSWFRAMSGHINVRADDEWSEKPRTHEKYISSSWPLIEYELEHHAGKAGLI